MRKLELVFISIILIIFLSGCATAKFESTWMDHPDVRDPSLNDPNYLVSTRIMPEEELDYTKPVIICAHGFSASTYAWWEFRDYAEATNNVLVSLVLLGGHGSSIEEFKETTWEDWGKPIMNEYNSLVELGYKNISIAGSSTGATLIMESLASGDFANMQAPNQLYFIDPFIVPTSTKLKNIKFFSNFIKYSEDESRTLEEKKHWYTNRPVESLFELKEISDLVRTILDTDGIILPAGTQLTTYKVKEDIKASAEGVIYIEKGIRDSQGNKTTINMMDSDKHVFTRGNARDEWDEADKELQIKIFNEIINGVLE